MSSAVLSFFGKSVCIHKNQIVQIGDKVLYSIGRFFFWSSLIFFLIFFLVV